MSVILGGDTVILDASGELENPNLATEEFEENMHTERAREKAMEFIIGTIAEKWMVCTETWKKVDYAMCNLE